jgi:steroid 5-alpha reductase family enzyme
MSWDTYLKCLFAMSAFGLVGWLISIIRSNVTHVDSMWSLFFLITAITTGVLSNELNQRAIIVIFLITIWALRLSIYLTWRNWGPHEDHRYANIRKNNQPLFWLKSIYIVFGLQTLLAWVISMSVYAAIHASEAVNGLDYLAIILFLFGFIWENLADFQLSRFKSNPKNKGNVLNTGVWRFSRHPNYFGESCIWWAIYLFALATGAWWAIISPILMTLLLLKVSGVSLLEQTIVDRRPAYVDYIRSTNAFFPGKPKS